MARNSYRSVSVVIPTYNRAHIVARAVDSALRAVIPGDEVILIDDGSEDDTERVAIKYGKMVRYIKTVNKGAGCARNLGIQAARHDLIAFLDSDDEWLPEHLQVHRTYHASEDVKFSFSNFNACYDNEPSRNMGLKKLTSWTKDFRSWEDILGPGIPYSRYGNVPAGWTDFNVHTGDLYQNMMLASYVSPWASVVRRDLAGKWSYFPEDLKTFEDWEFFIRLSREARVAYMDCATAINHVHSDKRLSGTDEITKVTTWLKILERTYGADADFMCRRGEEYNSLLRQLKSFIIKNLIAQGDTKAARAELRHLKGMPRSIRALGVLPGPAARMFCSVFRALRRRMRGRAT
jgi:glycosyltransferase involved in cell wall biosynthesis